MGERYTVDGGDELEAHIADETAMIAGAFVSAGGEDAISAVILGGGYGRGEGAVYRHDGRETTYNDYDFFVVTRYAGRSQRKRLHQVLSEVAHRLSDEVGIEVDIGAPLGLSDLSSLPYELMMMEMREGHRVAYGPAEVLGDMPRYDPARVPLVEGARLQLNRAAGLLQSRIKARNGESDAIPFAIRNTQKAMMAMGDGVLMVREAYSTSYVERARRLRDADLDDVPDASKLKALYGEAIEFKLRPSHEGWEQDSLVGRIESSIGDFETYHLWYERRRLGNEALDWEAYSSRATRLPRAAAVESLKNVVRNVRGGGVALEGWGGVLLHPRDHLMAVLPRVLYGNEQGLEQRWLDLWVRYN